MFCAITHYYEIPESVTGQVNSQDSPKAAMQGFWGEANAKPLWNVMSLTLAI